ncbi:hypothetical protein ACX0MV_07500 [Pseudomonas borbori]
MLFYCVEPAHDRVNDDYHGWNFTVRAGLGHHIAFPHVDSCLAIVCILPGNRVFAGHINGYYQGAYSAVSHQNAFQNLTMQLNGAAVQSAAVFGDVTTWQGFLGFPWVNSAVFLSNSCPNGVDVMFDVDNGTLQLMRYTANRDFKAITPQQVLASRNLSTVVGNVIIPC